ncbi:MAG: hypothetical protein AAF968_01545 [Pseudomonadota bacterium]
MQLIAHRIFRDREPIEPFGTRGTLQLDGVELDVRVDQSGNAVIDHAPLFMLRRSRLAQIPKTLRATVSFLATETPELDVLMLDIKSRRAAEAVARQLPELAPPFRLVFNCWHAAPVKVLREAFRNAELHYCIVPIFADRLPRTRHRDLFLYNSFPFLYARRRFSPAEDKVNAHAVNVRLMKPETLKLLAGVDGICVHRLFCTPELVNTARAQGFKLSVYGLKAGHRRLARLAPVIDYAIVRGLVRDRSDTPSNSLCIAM